MKPYNQKNIPLAKHLRKNMTPWERKLWYEYLRNYPLRFQRQKALGEHVVDFYCAKAGLVIELDGSGHYEPEQMLRDETRTKDLKKLGVTVLRICNKEIDNNFRGVCERIDEMAQKAHPRSASSTEGGVIYALGFFDGVHLGHQALLTACRELAQRHGCRTGVATFTGHPDTLVLGKTPELICSAEDRRRLLIHYNIADILELPFDRQLMEMPWQDFFCLLRQEHHAAGFVCGEDFRFGCRGEGTAQLLQKACREEGIPCTVVPQLKLDGTAVSSTHIRQLLKEGEMEEAVRFLGHPHILTGVVAQGKKLGRTIGIPTANLRIPEGVICPRFGVYACKATVAGETHLAVTNIGTRPTVSGEGITVEPWLLDYDGDLYGTELTLRFYAFLRPEQKFDTLSDLQAEIWKNAEKTRFLLKNS